MSLEKTLPRACYFTDGFSPGTVRAARNAFGSEGKDVLFEAIRGSVPSPVAIELADEAFFRNLSERLGSPRTPDGGNETSRQMYKHYMALATRTMEHIIGLSFPKSTERFGQASRLAGVENSPTERLVILADPDVDKVVKHELKRQFLIADMCARLGQRGMENGFSHVLAQFQDVVDRELFPGKPAGHTNIIKQAALHDKENRALYVYREGDDLPPPGPDQHYKYHEHKVRCTPDGTFVRADFRVKSESSSVIKALKKAIRNGGVIDPAQYVSDPLGFLFVVMGPEDKRDKFMKNTVEHLEHHPSLNVVEAVYDPIKEDTNGNVYRPDSSASYTMGRYQLYVKGLDAPIEAIFKTEIEFYDSLYHIGNWDEHHGRFTGSAHSLMEQRRIIDVLPYLFPERLYGADPVKIARAHMAHQARELRHASTNIILT